MSSSKRHKSSKPVKPLIPPRPRMSETTKEFKIRYLEFRKVMVQDARKSEDRLYDEYRRTGGTGSKEVFSHRQIHGPKPPVPLFDQPRLLGQNESQQTYSSWPSETPQANSQSTYMTETLHPSFSAQYALPYASMGVYGNGYFVSQAGGWDDGRDTWKTTMEQSHVSTEGTGTAEQREGYEEWRKERESRGQQSHFPNQEIGTTHQTSGYDRWMKERESGGRDIRSGMGKVL
ncbi:hypothetical protein EAF04_009294 [Stromatinia cepivora]|nr:hypothetical protein EAF04_009294 [Stromatinia cepivora]